MISPSNESNLYLSKSLKQLNEMNQKECEAINYYVYMLIDHAVTLRESFLGPGVVRLHVNASYFSTRLGGLLHLHINGPLFKDCYLESDSIFSVHLLDGRCNIQTVGLRLTFFVCNVKIY